MLASDHMHPAFPIMGDYYPLSHIYMSFKSLSLHLFTVQQLHYMPYLYHKDFLFMNWPQQVVVYKNLFIREPTVLAEIR